MELDIYKSGVYLGCQYGVLAMYIWGLGVLASGEGATMMGCYAGQLTMEVKLFSVGYYGEGHSEVEIVLTCHTMYTPLTNALHDWPSRLSRQSDAIREMIQSIIA